MRGLAEFLISAAELVDRQVYEVAETGKQAARSAFWSLALTLLTVIGAGLLLTSLVVALAPHIGIAGSTAIAGTIALLAGLAGKAVLRAK